MALYTIAPAYVADMANFIKGEQKVELLGYLCCDILTLLTAIQQVGMAASVYCVDCGNVAKMGFCD